MTPKIMATTLRSIAILAQFRKPNSATKAYVRVAETFPDLGLPSLITEVSRMRRGGLLRNVGRSKEDRRLMELRLTKRGMGLLNQRCGEMSQVIFMVVEGDAAMAVED